MSYTKLFSHIITSTIWREPKEVKILWITMLALSNKHGEVMASIPGLADMARLTLEETEVALAVLEGPDAYSRTPDEEGRRVFRIDGGWHVINYQRHRRMASIDEQREMNAARQRRWYKRHQKPNADLTVPDGSVTHSNGSITHRIDNAEAEAEYRSTKSTSEEKGVRGKNQTSSPTAVSKTNLFDEFWNQLPSANKVGKKKAREAWAKAVKEGASEEDILAGINSYRKYEKLRRNQNDYRPLHPTTWLNAGRWEDAASVERKEAYNPWD